MAIELFDLINHVYETQSNLGDDLSRAEIVGVLAENSVESFTVNTVFMIRSRYRMWGITYYPVSDEYHYHRVRLAS